jgi:hypothetical protein
LPQNVVEKRGNDVSRLFSNNGKMMALDQRYLAMRVRKKVKRA